MVIVTTTRSHDHKGVAVDDRAGEHALALLTRLAACGVELDGGHASGLPAPLAKSDGKACFMQGIHGLQDEITGLRHKTYDVPDLIKKMEKLLVNPDLRYKMGINGNNYVKINFTATSISNKWLNFYQNLYKYNKYIHKFSELI